MKWWLVDERDDQREQFTRLLRNYGVEVEEVCPDPSFEVLSGLPISAAVGFILDYALHEQNSAISYSGATLAAHLREDYPDRPIVILSAFLRDPATDERLRRTSELIDLKVKKDEVEQRPERFAEQLTSLSAGYGLIRGLVTQEGTTEAAACTILGLQQTSMGSPAIAEVVAHLVQVGANDVSLVARLLLHELLRFPGPLLPPNHAAVVLGVDPYKSPDEVRLRLEPAKYRGAFHNLRWDDDSPVPLYWRSSLAGLKASATGLPPATCFICGQPASTLCAECERPIDGRHSLPAQRSQVAYPECRQTRICGNCLRKREFKSQVALDPRHAMLRDDLAKESRELLKKSRQGS